MQVKTKAALGATAKIMLIFAMVLLVAEEILALFSETAVISLLVALLGALVLAALSYALESAFPIKTSLQCFSLIFLTRVAVAVVPALILPPALLLATVYGVVLVICAVYIVDRRLSPGIIGFHLSNVPLQVLAGLAFGVVMGFAEFAILSSDIRKYLLFEGFSVSNFVILVVVMFWFVALGEELLFRGLAQTSLEREVGNPVMALMIVSLTFSIMHLGYVTDAAKTLEIVYVFTAATVIGYVFMKSKSLVFPIIAHGIANTILFGILPYLL